MAKQTARIGRTYAPVTGDIKIAQFRLAASDISTWKRAVESAKSSTNPRRKELYELYESVELDGHLLSVMGKRRMKITNKKVHFDFKNTEGENTDDPVYTAVLNTPWFYNLIKHSLEAKAYGHSLIELIPEQGVISKVQLAPRKNVSPELGILAFDANDIRTGIAYREDPLYSKHLIEIGSKEDFGLIMPAAQYVIYKRGGFGDWAQFAELFGMPFREGRYNAWDDEGRKKLDAALANMGGAGYAVIPDGTSLTFHDNNGTGKSEVYKDLVDACNAEISKIFLGNTMTTEDGSSRSQSETHEQSESDIILSDMIEMEYLLNWDIKDKFLQLGLPIPEGKFFYPEMQMIPLDKRIEMDIKLSEKVPIAEDYWYKTYGVPKPDGNAVPVKVSPKKEEPAIEPKPKDTAKQLEAMAKLTESFDKIIAIYKPHDCNDHS